ncbi:MAG: hypothetical protein ABSE28_05730 [Candidatus Sulfotelmatobacter sp.]|jgi:hypothetical protein
MAQDSWSASRGLKKKVEVGWSFLAGNLLLAGILVLAYWLRWLPVIALIAFLPVFIRGLVWFVQGPQLIVVRRRLGWTELAHALAFGALLTAGFGLIR